MVNENPDTKKTLLQELANIKEFKKEVGTLKKQLVKLTGRVAQLDLIGFQTQLDTLDERIKGLSKDLTDIRQRQLNLLCLTLRELADKTLHYDAGHVSPWPPPWQKTHDTCFTELQGFYMQANERIKHCQTLKEMEDCLNVYWDNINATLSRYKFRQIDRLK